jgi:L-threonylcarbamoyladenylate synthase
MRGARPRACSPAIFLDRDGTLIEDRGHLSDPDQVVFFPETFAALRLLRPWFRFFIVTNQPGVSAGVLSPDDVRRVNRRVQDRLAEAGVVIDDVYVCPHTRADKCRCIKPHPHFLLEAARKHDLNLAESYVIGDHPHDAALASAVGGRGIYVLTGHGAKHLVDVPPATLVVEGILEAALLILGEIDLSPPGEGVSEAVREAAAVIRNGGVVAFPTETVYGLGADAMNARAVERVFAIKGRPRFNPLIVHAADHAQARDLVAHFPKPASELAARFWPGPLTLVLPKRGPVPSIVTAGLPTVAVRVPDHPLALALIRLAGTPIAAPSANPHGTTSPTCAQHVRDGLGAQVKVVLDGGPCPVGIESTVVSFTGGEARLLRPGGVPVEEIEAVVGRLSHERVPGLAPASPGLLPRHYAPRTPLRLLSEVPEDAPRGRVGLLAFRTPADRRRFAAVEVLSPNGDLREAAANLFAAIWRLDALGLDCILAEDVPRDGLGRAIWDRLRRASHGADGPSPDRKDGHPHHD